MVAANNSEVIMAGDGNGAFIWPEFQPVVDGMMTVAKLLEYLVSFIHRSAFKIGR